MSAERTAAFARNTALEALLAELAADLAPAEGLLMQRYSKAGRLPHPLILVMGPLRSGTTLFMQWLAATGLVAYPTNLLSRFYHAPVIGAKIQRLLTDPAFNYRDELGDFAQPGDWQSENGKTRGALAPNEFWYFWRRFLADPARDVWRDDELLATLDIQSLRAELTGIMSVFGKPFAAKGMLFNYNIPALHALLENVLFVQIRRDPVANVASVLEARRRQSGDEATWYSFRIPEYANLQDLPPLQQAAGQVSSINRAIAAGMAQIPGSRTLVVDYEEFCVAPAQVYAKLLAALELPAMPYGGPASFQAARMVDPATTSAIRSALAQFE